MSYLSKLKEILKQYPNKISYFLLDREIGRVYIVFKPHTNKVCGLTVYIDNALKVEPSTKCSYMDLLPDYLLTGKFDITNDLCDAVLFLTNHKYTQKKPVKQEIFINLDEN